MRACSPQLDQKSCSPLVPLGPFCLGHRPCRPRSRAAREDSTKKGRYLLGYIGADPSNTSKTPPNPDVTANLCETLPTTMERMLARKDCASPMASGESQGEPHAEA